LIGIAIVAMFFLVVGLPSLVLDPGMPLQRIVSFLAEQLGGLQFAGPPPGGMTGTSNPLLVNILRTAFSIVLFVFPLALILVLLDPKSRKRVLATALRVAILMAVLYYFLAAQSQEMEFESEGAGGQLPEEEAPLPDPIEYEDFDAETISPWVARALSLAIGLVVALVALWIGRRVREAATEEKTPLDRLADQAEAAIFEIEQGEDYQNTILRCYAEMTRIVHEQLALQRGTTVTAREFINYLLRARLPGGPVRKLTQLFEEARYGSGTHTQDDERAAVTSLQAIADACRRATT
jgi:heme A synthase